MNPPLPPPLVQPLPKKSPNVVLIVVIAVVVAVVGIAILGILAAMLLPAVSSAKERSHRMACAANLKQVHIALEMYFADNQNRYPFTGASGDDANKHLGLLFPQWLRQESVFVCRNAQSRRYQADNRIDANPTGMTRSDTLKPGENSYAYAFGLDGLVTMDSPLACDQLAETRIGGQRWARSGPGSNHGSSGGNVVYRDGHVEWVAASGEGYWPPRKPQMKAMFRGQVRAPANATPAPGDN